MNVLVAIIACPKPTCGVELEGVWAEPEEPEDAPERALQLCGSCGGSWTAEWPGFSFRTEAG